MRLLEGEEKKEAMHYFSLAAAEAGKSKCHRKKGGSVIVSKDKEVIGRGYNSPPGDITLERCLKDDIPKDFKSDRTCCVHAEQRALNNGLRNHPGKVAGSRIYFVNVDDEGNIVYSGDPWCTVCSKLVLDEGIAEFALWHEDGIRVYDTEDYNKRSFAYRRS